jgi:hypothetical protein
MLKKYIYIVFAAFLIVSQSNAQNRAIGSGANRQGGSDMSSGSNTESSTKKKKAPTKPKIPSIIKTWKVSEQGTRIEKTELDTALTFYHVYQPIYQKSISNTFTGNNGGASISNDFFQRRYNSDFYFARSFDAYWLTPSQVSYFNTTTPFSLLDYSQSENRATKNETRFNVFLSQNVNKKLNFEFIYNQTKSQGQYPNQENKFHNIGLVSSYTSNNFLSHSNIIFNRLQGQENGGIDSGQPLDGPNKTNEFTVRMDDATNKLQNNTIFTVNEYRLGKSVEADTAANRPERFIPRVGFIHELEFSGNKRSFTKTANSNDFFANNYINTGLTQDSVRYTRLTNIFQIKFYEAPDRKFTFGKRAYIGHDQIWYHASSQLTDMGAHPFPLLGSFLYRTPGSLDGQVLTDKLFYSRQTNTFIGGGIFRNEGKFWQWEANGRIYLTGYRSGQTELDGFVNKPIKIGRDTTSLRIEGSLKTLVPEYFDSYFFSNNFVWRNNFDNINEMTIRSSIRSQEYKTELGVNYSLIGNYIYNNAQALPTQTSKELLVLSAYLNKDIIRDHWVIRAQALVQKANNENVIHLPAFAGFISLNYRTVISKVMHFQLGADTRYNSNFYADAYEPATARFYLQNTQMVGKYPYIDLHANLKLKRTRVFFLLMNAATGLVGNNYFSAPDYPYYRRTFRLGVSWSFYD